MVKCPECDGSEKIYLACVEIRDREVYNICNFSKRRYVKSFPTVEYWLSLIPIAPLIQRAVTAFCCQILPNLFDRYRDTVAPPPPPPQEGAMTGSSKAFRAKTTRNAVRSYKATDFNAIRREQTGGLMLYGKMATDVATNVVGPTRVGVEGLKKQAMLNAPVGDARRELDRAGVKVATIEPYDPTKADRYIADYARTPGRLAPGSEVVIYERDGKAVFFAEKRAAPAVAIDPDVEARIAELEARKSRLADVAEAQRELNELQARKAGFDTEIGVLRGQIEALKAERAAEERRIDELVRTRDGLKTDLDGLHDRLARLAETQKNLKRRIDRERPVSELGGVTPELSEALTRAGVRTVGDLAAADAATLRRADVTRNTRAANALIEEAKQRLDLTKGEG
jgi:hypothetical protein